MTNQQYVFETGGKIIRYRFPTHINDIVIPREQAAASEAFMVIIEKDSAPPLHKHDDTEQIYYILEGEGRLEVKPAESDSSEVYEIHPQQAVRIPPKTWHRVFAVSENGIKYFCVDCFPNKAELAEPTWEDHVRTVVNEQGWDFCKIREDLR